MNTIWSITTKVLLLAGAVIALPALAQPIPSPPPQAQSAAWPSLSAQLSRDKVAPGSALEKLIAANQGFRILRPEEANDKLNIPPWLRVLWRKAHPEGTYSADDPTGGYPLALHEVHEWMVTHQNLQPGTADTAELGTSTQTVGVTGEQRISGEQTSPRSESDIRINFFDPTKIIGASNNITGSGTQAMFFSTDSGATWGQTTLPLIAGDAFHGDPAVEWTSDGTAWSTTLGINPNYTVLRLLAYKSTDNGATWTFDAIVSGSQGDADKPMIWADHNPGSPFKDNLYAIWHSGRPVFMNRRTGPGGAWQTPIQVSGTETTGTGIGADVKTNSAGDVFGVWPDTGSGGIYIVKSTNGGLSFSSFPAPIRITTTFGHFDIGIPAMAIRRALIYTSAAVYRTATKNNVYVSWMDMTGVSDPNAPCNAPRYEPGTNTDSNCKTRIWFRRSTDGGMSWPTPPKMLNNQASKNDQFNQALTVDDTTGRISIIYYDTVQDPNRLKTGVFYQFSDDDGVTWSSPCPVTTAQTDETVAGADNAPGLGNQYGDYNALSGRGGVFFPSWTDRRNNGREEIWTAAISNCAAPAAPTSITAAASGTSVVVTWIPSANADSYHLERKVTGQSWIEVAATPVSTNPPTTLTDAAPPITDDGIAVYRVRASRGTLFSPYSPLDFAHPGLFTNDSIYTTVTTVKAVHLIEIRKGINAIADAAGLAPPYAAGELLPSSLTTPGRFILATDMTDAMSRLNAVRTSSPYGRTAAGFGVTPVIHGLIYGSQMIDLRNGLR
jgi:hypothetical protein